MRQDEKDKRDGSDQPRVAQEHLPNTRQEVSTTSDNVVFDFTGLRRPDVADLALILTARLKNPHQSVWVRAIDPGTARVLRALGLDHLFRVYPGSSVMH